ncbi:MAG: hypothetical protein IT438_08965 [Phycisphaerales bacterium]|nr:hypothetical protein [Phycisphaerales bacterium]
MRESNVRLGAVVVSACGAAMISSPALGWGNSSVNGFGFGTAEVRVWCAPNAPPAAPNHFVSNGPMFGPSASLGPGLAGCNPATFGSLTGGGLWRWNVASSALGGDVVDGYDLYPLVTPTSFSASASLVTSGSVLSSSSAMFTISWSGSDMGTAQRLRWLEPDGSLIREELRVGPWSETFTALITSSFPIEEIRLETCGVVTSIPSPGGAILLALAGFAIPRRRRV